MYVYPRQVDTARIQMICRAVSGMVLSRNRLYEDPFEFSGIRDYRKEDPMNRINWKSSARMGDLMVNQFDATTSVEVTVLLDIEDANILREEAQVEESIRITSSLAARMVKNKMNLWVKSNAKDEETGEELRVHLAAGAGKTAELNRKLACVQLGGQSHRQRGVSAQRGGKTNSPATPTLSYPKTEPMRSVRRFICSPVRRTRCCG